MLVLVLGLGLLVGYVVFAIVAGVRVTDVRLVDGILAPRDRHRALPPPHAHGERAFAGVVVSAAVGEGLQESGVRGVECFEFGGCW